jgi:hypothetical protein
LSASLRANRRLYTNITLKSLVPMAYGLKEYATARGLVPYRDSLRVIHH